MPRTPPPLSPIPSAGFLPSPPDVADDVQTALALAEYAPTGASAAHLRDRLRNHITALADGAAAYAAALPDGRGRDVAVQTVDFARKLAAARSPGDPAAVLRLMAKSVESLARYSVHPFTGRRAA